MAIVRTRELERATNALAAARALDSIERSFELPRTPLGAAGGGV
jgi:hypothetical protein